MHVPSEHFRVIVEPGWGFRITCQQLFQLGLKSLLQELSRFKVCGCYPVTFLDRTPLLDWCVVRSGSKNKHQKDTCLQEVVKYYYDIIVNTIGRTYVFIQGTNKPALSLTITKLKEVWFSILFWWCFIAHLLTQHKFCCVNPTQTTQRTWNANCITYTSNTSLEISSTCEHLWRIFASTT